MCPQMAFGAADQLAARYEVSRRAAVENNEVQKRIERRAARMVEDDAVQCIGWMGWNSYRQTP